MARSAFAFIPFILTAGAIVLLFFVVLAGITSSAPLNETYFIAVDLSKFANANVTSPTHTGHWTLWGICGADASGNNVNCPHASPAFPFDLIANLGTNGVPQAIANSANFFYYMSRFAFAFYLIALVFAVIAFVLGLLALCSRLGGAISSVFGFLALFFAVAAAALTTAWVVIARNDLSSAGIAASIGVKALGFSWGAVGALFLASFLYCCVACAPRNRHKDDALATPTTTTTTGRRRWFHRREKVPFDSEHTANGSY